MNYERGRQLEQTETGLALIIFGILFSPIPVVGPVGGLIALVGIMLTIMGRESYGKAQAKSVVIGAALFVAGVFLTFVESVVYTLFFLSVPGSIFSLIWAPDDALTKALVPYLTTFFAIGAAGTILTSIALMFFIFFLQKMPGRLLTLAAAAAGVAMSVLVFSLLTYDITINFPGQHDSLLIAYREGSDQYVAQAFEFQALIVGLLGFVPAIIYAAIYYRLYSNLN